MPLGGEEGLTNRGVSRGHPGEEGGAQGLVGLGRGQGGRTDHTRGSDAGRQEQAAGEGFDLRRSEVAVPAVLLEVLHGESLHGIDVRLVTDATLDSGHVLASRGDHNLRNATPPPATAGGGREESGRDALSSPPPAKALTIRRKSDALDPPQLATGWCDGERTEKSETNRQKSEVKFAPRPDLAVRGLGVDIPWASPVRQV